MTISAAAQHDIKGFFVHRRRHPARRRVYTRHRLFRPRRHRRRRRHLQRLDARAERNRRDPGHRRRFDALLRHLLGPGLLRRGRLRQRHADAPRPRERPRSLVVIGPHSTSNTGGRDLRRGREQHQPVGRLLLPQRHHKHGRRRQRRQRPEPVPGADRLAGQPHRRGDGGLDLHQQHRDRRPGEAGPVRRAAIAHRPAAAPGDERGVAAVEFALILPMFGLILAGIVDLAACSTPASG